MPATFLCFLSCCSAFFSAVLGGFFACPGSTLRIKKVFMEHMMHIYFKAVIVKWNKDLCFNIRTVGEIIESNLVEVSFLSFSFGVF